MIKEYEAIGGMKIDREADEIGENLPYYNFVLHKSPMS
jgi:hypothetical protein